MAAEHDDALTRTECFVLARYQAEDPIAAWNATHNLLVFEHGDYRRTGSRSAVPLEGLSLYGRLAAIRLRLLAVDEPDWNLVAQVDHWMKLIAAERRRKA